jgi:hypothetical protein
MQLLYEAESILRSSGFRIARAGALGDTVIFEDETVIGFVAIHLSGEEIVARWRDQQDLFLRTNAAQLRRDPSKAWNVYAVFLTAAPVDERAWEMLGIETDVNATRKIVRGGIITRADAVQALAPILPLAIDTIGAGGQSADAALLAKLGPEERELFERMSATNVDEQRVVNWLASRPR